MIDYNQPWGWGAATQQPKNNMVAPLGGGNAEGAPAPVMAAPSMQDQLTQKVGGVLANKAVDGAAKGLGEYMRAGEGLGQVVDATGGMETAAEAAGNTLGAGASAAGPIGAAVGGAMKGEYDEAAGAALGSVLGAYFGPIGSMAGAKLGGYAGNAVGGMFGLADGTPKVPEKKSTMQTIWDRILEKGAEAVKASTGNDGAVGQAKQSISSRKERLDAEERKAMGYAWGSSNVGGKGASPFGGNTNTVLNRPYGSTAPTGYYGAGSQGGFGASPTIWRPQSFTTTNQQVPTVNNNVVAPEHPWGVGQNSNAGWAAGPGGWGGGDSAGEGGGGTAGADASSGSGIGNGAEGDSAGPGGDAGAGGGGGGGGK